LIDDTFATVALPSHVEKWLIVGSPPLRRRDGVVGTLRDDDWEGT
jgi:hypothetical protein